MAISIGQAAANALTAWLKSQVPNDVAVYPHWADPDVVFGRLSDASPVSKIISVVKYGRRQRLDVNGFQQTVSTTAIAGSTLSQVRTELGSFIQPMRIEIWATSDMARESVIALLDVALSAGFMPLQVGANPVDADPLADHVVVPLLETDNFVGNVDFWFDAPEYDDDADNIQRNRYTSAYFGEARGIFSLLETVPTIQQAQLDITINGSSQVVQVPIPRISQQQSPSPSGQSSILGDSVLDDLELGSN